MQESRETENKNNNDTDLVRGNPLRDLSEFTKNLVDEGVPSLRDTPASSSRESHPEPPRRVVSDKHSIYTHFPKDRNCEIRKKTKITRAPCRRRTGKAIPRAESFGDLITANHKVPSEG